LTYKVNLTDSLGNQIAGYPVDNIPGSQGLSSANVPIYAAFATTTALLSAYGSTVSIPNGTVVITGAYANEGDAGGSQFYYNATDVTSADNSGTIRVDIAGRRWYAITGVNEIKASLFGVFPNTGGDVSTGVVNALNIINGLADLVFEVGIYTFSSNDISASTTATTIRFRGAAPAYLNGKPAANNTEINAYLDTGAALFTQTVPSWVVASYTVFQCNGTGFFGHPDTSLVANFSYDNFNVSNIVFWAGASHEITFHVQPIGSHISDCTFVLAKWFAICNRDFDQHSYKRCAFYDCGWGLAQSGSFSENFASTYVTGCAIVEGGTLSPQVYQSPVSGNTNGNGTQGLLEEIYIFNRTYFLNSLSGYAGVYANNTGDLTLRRVESITGCVAINSVVNLDSCHIESFAKIGYSGSSEDYTLWAAVFYDSIVNIVGGWGQGAGMQLHYGPNAPGNPYPYTFILSNSYTVDETPRPQLVALGQNPTFLGCPLRADIGTIGLNPTAGQGETSTVTWSGVIDAVVGYHGLVAVTVSNQHGLQDLTTALFLVNASFQSPSSYAFNSVQIGSNLVTGWDAGYAVTITLSTSTEASIGQNLIVSIDFTGASWMSSYGVDVSVSMLGGTVPSSNV
jgi:hypothetical protein